MIMSAPVQLFPHKSGDSWPGLPSIAITVDGEPLDLTGATIRMQFKQFISDSIAALSLSSQGGSPGIVVAEDPTTGVFSVPRRVIPLKPGRYFWDIEVTHDSQPVTYVAGTWQITSDVSR